MLKFFNTAKRLFIFFIVANAIFLIGLFMFMNKVNIPLSRFILLISAVLNFAFYIFLIAFLYRRFIGNKEEK